MRTRAPAECACAALCLISFLGTYPDQLGCLIPSPKLLQAVILLLLEVGLLLYFGLVETVDDAVLALRDEDALDFAGIFEADLADFHGAIFFEVGPGGVDDGDVVFFVTWARARLSLAYHIISEQTLWPSRVVLRVQPGGEGE
jgi:hypothetical protein